MEVEDHAQERLIELLTGPEVELCVVGDDDQAIYQWRGSDVSNIVTFASRYPGVATFGITTNRRRVHVLVLVDDEVAEVGVHLGPDVVGLELAHRPHHLLAECEEPVPLQRGEVVEQHRPEGLGHGGRVEQLVLDHVDALQEPRDRAEEPAFGVQLLQAEPGRLPGQERRELMVVQHVERLVAGHVGLQEAEAVGMDRPHEQAAQAIQHGLRLGHAQ